MVNPASRRVYYQGLLLQASVLLSRQYVDVSDQCWTTLYKPSILPDQLPVMVTRILL